MTKFPLKFTALWRQIYPALLVGALLGQSVEWLQGGRFSLPSMMPLMAVALSYVLYLHFFYPTLAGRSGLKLINGWGWRRLVLWPEIVEVRQARRLGIIPSLRVLCANGRVYWIDTEIGNLSQLHTVAVQAGGAEHPLVVALATPQYAL